MGGPIYVKPFYLRVHLLFLIYKKGDQGEYNILIDIYV